MHESDVALLARYKRLLERPSFAVRASNLIGRPLEHGIERLPKGFQLQVHDATRAALGRALDAAVLTMEMERWQPTPLWYKLAASASGAVGGAFGLPALLLELPISTLIMLRSVADVAREHGEDLDDPQTRLECLNVFALGGAAASDDASETGYFAVRAAMTQLIREAAGHVAKRGLVAQGAPALLRLLTAIAARFHVQVTEKTLAQALPLLGSVGGAAINFAFANHFQDVATGHFGVRRLERSYGATHVREVYESIATGD